MVFEEDMVVEEVAEVTVVEEDTVDPAVKVIVVEVMVVKVKLIWAIIKVTVKLAPCHSTHKYER